MRLFIVINLLLLQIFNTATIHKTINVIFVEPTTDNEVFTPEEQTQSIQHLSDAINYWQDLSPISTELMVGDTKIITVSYDVYNNTGRLYIENVTAITDYNTITLFVIDNSNSHRMLDNNDLGLSWQNAVWVVSVADVDTYAHELGHNVYNLPHQPDIYDIMGQMPFLAYNRHMIGCGSLQLLGYTCTYVYVPFIERE